MQTAQEVYEENVRPLPPEERLRVATMILRDLAEGAGVTRRPSMLELIETLPPGPRLFQTPGEVDRYLQEERESWDR